MIDEEGTNHVDFSLGKTSQPQRVLQYSCWKLSKMRVENQISMKM